MSRGIDVTALGELLVDFIPLGERQFEAKAGGAPANVLAALARLGHQAAFIGMVGDDGFGSMLAGDLQAAGIQTQALRRTAQASTTLAFVQLDAQGERSFTFVRRPGADTLLEAGQVDAALIGQSRVLHVGSLSMTHEPARSATLHALDLAQRSGCLISYDPNLRPALWPDLDAARSQMLAILPRCHIVKVSLEEMTLLTGEREPEAGARALHAAGPALVMVTLGAQGCFLSAGGLHHRRGGFKVAAVDTTGAGDAFLGAALSWLLTRALTPADLTGEHLSALATYACAAGALCTTRPGGIPAMASSAQIAALIRGQANT